MNQSTAPALSVIAPCYNEEGNLRELVSRLTAVFARKQIAGEIVLVNDCSTDGTGALIDALAAEDSGVVSCHHAVNQGLAAGWATGLAASRGAYVCLIDADLQNLPEDVWRLYREITTNHVDMVQGYRSSVGRLKDSRYTLSTGLNFLLNFLFGMSLRDNKSGFIICRREILGEILRRRFHYHHFQSFITIAAKTRGLTIREIETIFQSRLVGKSFIPSIPAKLVVQVLSDLVKAFVEYRLSLRPLSTLAEYLKDKPPTHPKHQPLRGIRNLWLGIYAWTMPLHGWIIGRNIKTYYEELNRTQWLAPAEIKELQEIKLRRLVNQAYYHVAYYRELFDQLGIKPDDIRTLDDLQKIPLLDKKTIREHIHFDLLSDNHDKSKLHRISTSGSTGEPFICYADKFQLEMRWAATLRSQDWTGYRFGDRCARLWHQTIGMSWTQIVREKLDAWMTRRVFIPAYEMSEKNLARYMGKLRHHKPVLIDGYAESFNFLAHYIKQNGLKGVRPKGIISSAQILPEQSRKTIEEEFGCGAFDKYGSREFSGIAYESDAHDGHLVVAENFIVEILKDGKPAAPGEMGEVVITDLNNFCMPFIRYRVGDLASAMDNSKPSPCGRGLPRIGRIEGRVQAIIFGTNGNFVPGTFFAHLFKDFDHVVSQYQVIQDSLGAVNVKIVKAPRFTEEGFEEIMNHLRRFLGEDMKFNIEYVDLIPLGRTGKRQGAISKLGVDFQNLQST
jgi:phenylacetate-CoA ligase